MTARPQVPRHRLRPLALACALFVALTTMPAAAAPAGTPIDIQQPAQPLDQALVQLAARTGMMIGVDAALVRGRRAPALNGSYTAPAALRALLEGSGLDAAQAADGSWVLRKATAEQGAEAVPRAAAAASGVEPILPVVRVKATAVQETATSPVPGYAARRSATGTKTDTPLSETPQSVTVITRDQITATGATSLDQALAYAAGVRDDIWGVSARLDAPQVRGSEPTVYLDGLNDRVQYWTSTVPIEPYLLERIEVLRGPSSMLFGQGGTAGIVNNVSKQPQAEAAREVGLQVGSFQRRQSQADLTGPLTDDGQWLYRLVALGRDAGTQRQYGAEDRRLVAPSLTWQPSAATQWTFRAKWQQERASGDSGDSLPWDGSILPNPNGRIPRDAFVGEPTADHFDADNVQLGWSFSHRFDEQWAVRQNLRWTDNKVDYASVYAYGPYLDAERRLANRYGYYWKRQSRILSADQQLEGVLTTGAVRHRVLAGLDLLRYRSTGEDSGDSPVSEGGTLAPIDIYAPQYDAAYAIPAYTPIAPSGITQAGLYLQDQMTWGPWTVVAGLRHDRSKNWEQGAADRLDRANSRRLGAMLAMANGVVPYVSYSESFEPQANTNAGQRLDPLRGEQWEAGVKFEPADARWRAQAAVYELREKARTVEISPIVVLQTGQTRNSGLELEWVGRATPQLDINASYTYTKIDAQLVAAPRHRASVWGSYRFALGGLAGFSAGAGVRHAGSFTDGVDTPTTPSMTLFDAMLAWEGPSWRLALNVSNLADRQYFSNCWSWGECSYGAARNVSLTTSHRF